MLERLLKSKSETAVLGVVLFQEGLHVREIARRAGVSPFEAKRELDNLAGLGVLVREEKGNLVTFSLNRMCPFLPELTGLYTKTDGAAGVLSRELSTVPGIKLAFIFGSFASGNFNGKSDVDLLVIGDAGQERMGEAALRAQKRISREMNYILWSEKELAKKAREGGAFVSTVLKNRKIWLVGDELGLKRLVENGRGKEKRA